ncbi:transmembrane protein, putative [Medicago truncatula]|uniref:Transmembrane protein, putative n=1 Tax=Medicago truncatula TaxID=3880 RepID=G7JSN7_MEDTR|nr:transmembrane protein, putative [Medicago truncatula]
MLNASLQLSSHCHSDLFAECLVVVEIKIRRYLIGSDCQISFDPVQIQSMTLASSTLQIRRHGYSGYLNIVICVGLCTLPFYAINMDVVSLFTNSSFLFLANLHYIDVLCQFE